MKRSQVRSGALAALLAATILSPARAHAADAEADAPGDAIIITGERADTIAPSPATVESVDADRLQETTNVVNTEDTLRYLPSLLVRKRHIGDTQAPLATRTSGVGASARSLIYVDGVLLSALIGNNNSFASPRWGIVSPGEVDRVDVLYGPFSAAYPGNSIGAVVNISTRMPDKAQASLTAGTSVQTFDQYGTHGTYPVYQLAATAGDRLGPVSLFGSINHVDSRSQPLAYATVAQPTSASPGGLPVSGALPGLNRTGAPIWILGAGGFEHQRQDTPELKIAVDLSPALRIGYRGALFFNDTEAHAQSYLAGPDGPVLAGTVSIDGRKVTIPASAFSNNVYTLNERHWMHALTLDGGGDGSFQWRAIASFYDFDKDVQRTPSTALPAAIEGGPCSILRTDGTGWKTLDMQGRWHQPKGSNDFSFGAHADLFELQSHRYSAVDWRRSNDGTLVQASEGRTRTLALWAQDRISLASEVDLTLGARYEWWRAWKGFNFSATPALSVEQPEQHRQGFSPKLSLAWTPANTVKFTASAGQAYRFPTVSELYQAVSTGPSITVPDPSLKPERARSEELAAEWTPDKTRIRVSLFNEAIHNALISQTAPLVPGSQTLFNYVQNVPKVRTRGVELAFDRQDLLPGVEISGSATFADPKTVRDPAFPVAEGKDLPQVPRRRATLVATWHANEAAAFTLAGRYSSRSFATIDNSDPVGHTWQGFEGYFVVDARASFRIGSHWELAVGADNIGGERYFLFHPFPQRSFTAQVTRRW